MLLGPYATEEEAQIVCSGSSSSSCSDESCPTDVTITGPCGLELSGGIIYSIGTQEVTVSSFSDDCECIEQILINGQPVPYNAADGEVLSITLTLNDGCFYASQDAPTCVVPMFGITEIRGSKVRMRLLPENIAKYLLSRRKGAVASGK